MSDYYKGRIKVVGGDMMCFPVHPETLEPQACGCYDPYAWSDPDPDAVQTITLAKWETERIRQRDRALTPSRNPRSNDRNY